MEIWRHEPNENPITLIAKVIRQPVPLYHGDHACNGQLMAAAPDLLEACMYLLGNAEAAEWGDYMLETAKAAIKKATGEETYESS